VPPDAATTLHVNGVQATLQAGPDTPLLYLLRNDLQLKGAKFGCGLGLCGACTVLVDGEPARSCDVPLWSVEGRHVVTIEGLAKDMPGTSGQNPGEPQLHALQQAFLDEQAAQCGYCTSGMIMAAAGLLLRCPRPTRADIDQALDRNLCRCGSHSRILRAIERAAAQLAGDGAVRP
jgi:nicotinate dehydrogenase subunit A